MAENRKWPAQAENFGLHVQYSVFKCNLKLKEYQRLRKRLKALINKKGDDVRFYFLCKGCLPKTVVIGPRKEEPIEGFVGVQVPGTYMAASA